MQKPSGYDTAKAETFGEFKGLSDGPKICVIIKCVHIGDGKSSTKAENCF
jgi:hypothetical protein